MSYIEIPGIIEGRKAMDSIELGTYASIDEPLRGLRRLWARITGRPLAVRRLYRLKYSLTVGPQAPVEVI